MRTGPNAYRFDCPNGTYVVTLGFTELAKDWASGPAEGPRLRAFSVGAFFGVFVNAQGGFSLPLPVPDHAIVTGLRFCAQAGIVSAGSARLTNGLVLLIGP